MKSSMIITIDGPTASGKSTLAKELALKLNIYHLNTGFLYRGVAYILVYKYHYDQEKLKTINPAVLEQIMDKFSYKFSNGDSYVFFNNIDITSYLKNKEIDLYSSIISQDSKVRKTLISFQKNLAKHFDLVCEGRDCGSIVFPDADLKIYLTADLQVRALRWQKYMKSKGKQYTAEESIKFVSERDQRDTKREVSPLTIPQNAIIIDNSNLSEEQVLNKIINLYKKRND